MVKKALILHAWHTQPDSLWYSWLKQKLEEKRHEVYLPEIPTMKDDYPDMNKQLNFIENLLKIDKETTIISHSLGCLLALRLAEKHSYQKMILVAGWDFDDLTVNHQSFWPNKINHDLIKKNVKEIYCVTSDNDPYITAFQAEEMNKRLNGKCILIKNGGHFATAEKTKQIIQLLPLL